jgi:arabinan endo-1,5-alpha-L-arabinosidase
MVTPTERVTLLRAGTNSKPKLEEDDIRNGKFVHLLFGANGNESYVSIANPLYEKDIEEGVTLTFWVKRTDNNAWDALFGFYNKTQGSRLYMSGGGYIGYNNNAGDWIDINHPSTFTDVPIGVGRWYLVTVTISKKSTSGITLYVDGSKVSECTYDGMLGGTAITKGPAFDYTTILDHITNCSKLTLGYGSFWGSPDVCVDDLMVHDRVLSRQEISALKQMMSRVYDLGATVDIEEVYNDNLPTPMSDGYLYDLSGRRVDHPTQGIYIRNGKKVIVGN